MLPIWHLNEQEMETNDPPFSPQNRKDAPVMRTGGMMITRQERIDSRLPHSKGDRHVRENSRTSPRVPTHLTNTHRDLLANETWPSAFIGQHAVFEFSKCSSQVCKETAFR